MIVVFNKLTVYRKMKTRKQAHTEQCHQDCNQCGGELEKGAVCEHLKWAEKQFRRKGIKYCCENNIRVRPEVNKSQSGCAKGMQLGEKGSGRMEQHEQRPIDNDKWSGPFRPPREVQSGLYRIQAQDNEIGDQKIKVWVLKALISHMK